MELLVITNGTFVCMILPGHVPIILPGGGGGGALPSNKFMGMCRWMGRIFTTGLTIMGLQF